MSVGAFDGVLAINDMRNCKPIIKKQIHSQSINFVGVT